MRTFSTILDSPELEQTEVIESGLPTDTVSLLKEYGLSFTEMADVVIAPRTLKHRRDRGEHLSPDESDRVLRIARILLLASSVFDNKEKAMAWMRFPAESLGGRAPLSLIRSEAGGRLVEGRLWQIDEGMFA